MNIEEFKESIKGKAFFVENWIKDPNHIFTKVIDMFLGWLYSQGYEIVKKD